MITPLDETHGIIERLEPRANELYRPRIANVDLVLIVMAYNRPEPVPMLLDRLLILILHAGLTPVIVLNKCDLEASQKAVDIMRIYKALGFELSTPRPNNAVVWSNLTAVKGKIAVFAGPSGTGKSTLLNSLVDNLAIKTQEVSAKIGRGRHTTRHVELYPMESGGWIADTPGFSVLDLPEDLSSRQLGAYYPEFAQPAGECRFQNCLHYREVECGVKQALRMGRLLSCVITITSLF